MNESVLSLVPRLSNMTLPAASARARAADIDRQPVRGAGSSANQPHVAAAVDRRDRRTDGQTDEHTTVA